MIKIENVVKTDDYYQIVLSEGRQCIGILLGVLEDRMDIEFMVQNPKNPDDIVLVTEETDLEKYNDCVAKYLQPVMDYIDKINKN